VVAVLSMQAVEVVLGKLPDDGKLTPRASVVPVPWSQYFSWSQRTALLFGAVNFTLYEVSSFRHTLNAFPSHGDLAPIPAVLASLGSLFATSILILPEAVEIVVALVVALPQVVKVAEAPCQPSPH